MPIYDSNGSVWSECGYVYDNNGSVYTQIGKVYDNNGTTNSLIYESNITFYPGYTVQGTQSGGDWGSFYASSTNSNGGWGRAYIAVNLTGLNSIKITCTYSCQNYAQLFIGICSNFATHAYDMQLSGYIKKSAVYKTDANTAPGETNKTVTLDVSDLSGTYYIGIQAYSGSIGNAVVSASISSIVQVS